MENRKDIGKVISDKLNSFDKTPKEQLWSGINYELQKKKKRRLGFFFFWGKTLGFLVVSVIAGLYIYNLNGGFDLNSQDNSKETTNANSINKKTSTNSSDYNNSMSKSNEKNINSNPLIDNENINNGKNKLYNKNTIDKKNTVDKVNLANSKNEKTSTSSCRNSNPIGGDYSKSGKSKTSSFSTAKIKKVNRKSIKKSKKIKTKLSSAKTNLIKKEEKLIDLSSLQNKNLSDLTSKAKTKKIDSIIKKDKEKKITIKMYPKDSIKKDSAKIYKKFYIDVFASPTKYGYFAKGSMLDNRLALLSKKSEIKFSYGVGLTCDLNAKVSVRIGYSKVNISFVTINAPANTNNYDGIGYNPNISNETIYGASNGSEKMNITQKISYTEIPLEVKYKLLDKKIGVKSSLGFSYLLLDENKISIKTQNGYSQDIGKTNNLSDISLSVNLGIEMDYPLFKNIKIFVEPMFNYQIKAFSNSDFKTYLIGIHAGIRYSISNK